MRYPMLVQRMNETEATIRAAEMRGRAGLYVEEQRQHGETWQEASERIIGDKNHPAIYRKALEAVR